MNKTIETNSVIQRSSSKSKVMRTLALLLVLGTLLPGSAAIAADTFADGTIINIEAEMTPFAVVWNFSASQAPCPQNPIYPGTGWLHYWSSDRDQNKAVYAAILAAYLSGKQVHITWNTDNCEVSSVRLAP
jgi:hypothetical protein